MGLEVNPNARCAKNLITNWVKRYRSFGYEGLVSKMGKYSKRRTRRRVFTEKELAGMSREDLIKVIRAQECLVEESANEENKSEKPAKAEALAKKFQMKATLAVGVAGGFRSGYYKWISHRRVGPCHNPALFAAVEEERSKRNGVRGSRRISLALYKRGMVLNIKTVKRYMHYLSLRSTIRRVSSYRKPRAVIERRTDYIKRIFEFNGVRWSFTTTPPQPTDIRGCADRTFWLKMAFATLTKLRLQESWVRNKDHSQDGILLLGRVRSPFDRRKVEYLFSVLKQECLRWFKDPMDIENARRLAPLITLDYNLVREQSQYGWKSPIQNLK